MIDTFYVEEEISNHPRVLKLKNRFPSATWITCSRYTEIFNRKAQHFRLQKKRPALILAKKYGTFLHPVPKHHGIGANKNYYFSPVLNCPFDCSYCFLQGMHQSAHFLFFVNLEDFQKEIINHIGQEKITLFSGYDGDSLALEPYTGFVKTFLPFIENHPTVEVELRTKSVQIGALLRTAALPNCIVAFTLSPDIVAKEVERRAPPLKKRLEAIQKLQEKGWPIGLRFDPIIPIKEYVSHYPPFFKEVFTTIAKETLHSVTLGTFRLPKTTLGVIKTCTFLSSLS
jgi:spore photoproduct lyase